MSYFITTDITPAEIVKATTVNKKQDEVIYDFMKNGNCLDCWQLTEHFPFLVTSIRRTLNTLHRDKKIELIKYVPGKMGRPVGSYRIVNTLKLF